MKTIIITDPVMKIMAKTLKSSIQFVTCKTKTLENVITIKRRLFVSFDPSFVNTLMPLRHLDPNTSKLTNIKKYKNHYE